MNNYSKIILFPDENIYKIWINSDTLELKELEDIEKLVGEFILIPKFYENLKNYLHRIKYRIQEKYLVYKNKIKLDNDRYFEILKDIDYEKFEMQLEDLRTNLKVVTRKINQGISRDDIDLIANAFLISMELNQKNKLEHKRISDCIPFIISNDSDILYSCNIISSYFGLRIIYLSIFELIRLCYFIQNYKYGMSKLYNTLQNYCRELGISPRYYNTNTRINKNLLIEDLRYLGLRCHLGYHPCDRLNLS